MFEEGDLVKIIKNTNYSFNNVGDVGVIGRSHYLQDSKQMLYEVFVTGGPTKNIWSWENEIISAKELTREDIF